MSHNNSSVSTASVSYGGGIVSFSNPSLDENRMGEMPTEYSMDQIPSDADTKSVASTSSSTFCLMTVSMEISLKSFPK